MIKYEWAIFRIYMQFDFYLMKSVIKSYTKRNAGMPQLEMLTNT